MLEKVINAPQENICGDRRTTLDPQVQMSVRNLQARRQRVRCHQAGVQRELERANKGPNPLQTSQSPSPSLRRSVGSVYESHKSLQSRCHRSTPAEVCWSGLLRKLWQGSVFASFRFGRVPLGRHGLDLELVEGLPEPLLRVRDEPRMLGGSEYVAVRRETGEVRFLGQLGD